jgi:hypothetical protein
MEGYAAGKPAASADAGLAVLVSELTGLVGELAGAGRAAASFDEVEQLVMVRGRELLRKVILEAYRFRRQLYYATCAILVSIPSSYSEGVRYPSPF